eukprot:scaffold2879_cov269-Prasinococcus_capsulatus_cf.AAC.9
MLERTEDLCAVRPGRHDRRARRCRACGTCAGAWAYGVRTSSCDWQRAAELVCAGPQPAVVRTRGRPSAACRTAGSGRRTISSRQKRK